jgi:hypothetical protein
MEHVMADQSNIDEILDALELMVEQYMAEPSPDLFDHWNQTAGEEACAVLAKYRPERWELHGRGIRRKPEGA